MTHPVTPPDGANRPSNGRSVLGPDPASTDDFGQPVDRAWPGTDPDPGPLPPAERQVDVAGPDRRQFCWTHLHATQFNTPVR